MVSTMVNGATLAWDEAGAGPPLLLLHAGITDRRMWDDVLPLLATGHRVIRVDLRGFGETPHVPGEFAHAEDMVALLATLGIERAHVCGVSMGGIVALGLAATHPEVVDRLVLVAPAIPEWDWDPSQEAFDEAEEAALARGDRDAATWMNVDFWVAGPHRSREDLDPVLRDRVFAMQRRAFDLADPAADGRMAGPGWLDVWDRVTAPTLVVTGALDHADFAGIAERIVERFADARAATLPGVAHLPPMEDPEGFARLVIDHLAG